MSSYLLTYKHKTPCPAYLLSQPNTHQSAYNIGTQILLPISYAYLYFV